MSAMKKTADQLVAEASALIETVPLADAVTLVEDDGIQFIDIRDIRELWREGKIPGAYHAPRGMLEFWACPESKYAKQVFQSGKKLILYCAGAARSALAARALQEMGLDNVSHLEGGFGGWRAAGGAIEAVEPKS